MAGFWREVGGTYVAYMAAGLASVPGGLLYAFAVQSGAPAWLRWAGLALAVMFAVAAHRTLLPRVRLHRTVAKYQNAIANYQATLGGPLPEQLAVCLQETVVLREQTAMFREQTAHWDSAPVLLVPIYRLPQKEMAAIRLAIRSNRPSVSADIRIAFFMTPMGVEIGFPSAHVERTVTDRPVEHVPLRIPQFAGVESHVS